MLTSKRFTLRMKQSECVLLTLFIKLKRSEPLSFFSRSLGMHTDL